MRIGINHRKYFRGGIEALKDGIRGGKRYSILTDTAEDMLKEWVRESRESGDIVDAESAKKKIENIAGKEVSLSTVYRILTRHGWKKNTTAQPGNF